jgi:glutamine amidotransferase
MVGIVDYKAGNLTSVKRALDYLAVPNAIFADPAALLRCDRIIFPGVGNAASAMETLRRRGLDRALTDAFVRGIPILGICLGAQIILTSSEEGNTECLNLIEGRCRKFVMEDPLMKIPHMGWNEIAIARAHPVLEGVKPNSQVYFVHSYYPLPTDDRMVFATCAYGRVFPCAIGSNNLFATQFHLEKSGPVGLSMLKNFASWDGRPC